MKDKLLKIVDSCINSDDFYNICSSTKIIHCISQSSLLKDRYKINTDIIDWKYVASERPIGLGISNSVKYEQDTFIEAKYDKYSNDFSYTDIYIYKDNLKQCQRHPLISIDVTFDDEPPISIFSNFVKINTRTIETKEFDLTREDTEWVKNWWFGREKPVKKTITEKVMVEFILHEYELRYYIKCGNVKYDISLDEYNSIIEKIIEKSTLSIITDTEVKIENRFQKYVNKQK